MKLFAIPTYKTGEFLHYTIERIRFQISNFIVTVISKTSRQLLTGYFCPEQKTTFGVAPFNLLIY
jgi:hypothetical protein